MAFQEIEFINGVTKLNKATMDEFQNNIKNEFNSVNNNIENINESISSIDTGITSTITKYSDGYVIKYSNGVMEQVKEKTFNVTTSQLWSGAYISAELDTGNWFEEFFNIPFVSYKIDSGTNACFLIEKGNTAKLKISNIHVGRNDSKTFNVTIHIYGKGFWKDISSESSTSIISSNDTIE